MGQKLYSENSKKQRKDWVDALRALAMFLVILGHQLKGKKNYFLFTSPVKIPLFFMITGYVFNYNRKSTPAFFKNLFFKLVIPWLCLTVPIVFLRVPFKGVSVIPSGILDILSGVTAWYMPCCIVAEIIWFFICKYMKSPGQITIAATCVAILGFLAGNYNVLNIAMINRAMIAQIYILMGYLFKLNEEKFVKMHWALVIIMAAIYVIMGIVSQIVWPGLTLDVHVMRYYNYFYCILMIVVGCFTLFFLADKLSIETNLHIPGIICFLGQNTLVYYLLNTYNIALISNVIIRLPVNLPEVIFIVVKLVFAYLMCGIETLIILKVAPQILGRKARVKK